MESLKMIFLIDLDIVEDTEYTPLQSKWDASWKAFVSLNEKHY